MEKNLANMAPEAGNSNLAQEAIRKWGPDPAIYYQCVHCGLCTAACPTYTELGDENESPRGRIYLMRLVHEGRLAPDARVKSHLELCLDCRACETACPSGVPYGRIIEPFRNALHQLPQKESLWQRFLQRWVLLGVFPYRKRIRLALSPVRLAQRLKIYWSLERLGLFRLLPKPLREMASLVPELGRSLPPLPAFLPAKGRPKARVGLFLGCVADGIFRGVHWATARVLQQAGCDVVIPENQVCCGAIHFHVGDSETARHLADANLAAFSADGLDAIVVNHAGCGAMLKEYPHHWKDDHQEARRQFAAKIRDVNEFLDCLGIPPPPGRIPLKATYHDACHLAHAQRITAAPRRLLAQIPGLEIRELPESEICCGSAGTYNLLHPRMADRLGRRKLENILATGAEVVLASNAGCLLQIMREIRRAKAPVVAMHPIELLDYAYREECPPVGNNRRNSR